MVIELVFVLVTVEGEGKNPGPGGYSHMKGAAMLAGTFELNP